MSNRKKASSPPPPSPWTPPPIPVRLPLPDPLLLHPVEIARGRLRQARRHLETLTSEIHDFLESGAYSAERVTNWEEGYQHVIALVRGEPLETIGGAVGDAVHNMRSALDNLIWQFARQHSDPPGDPYLNFPIFEVKSASSGSRWDKQGVQKMRHVAGHVAAVVEQFQPFNTNAADPQGAHLWVLNRLWNDDKHQRAAAVGSSTSSMRGNLHVKSTGGGLAGPFFLDGPLQDGDVLAGLFFNEKARHDFETDYEVDFHVALPAEGPARGGRLPECLLEIYEYLDKQLLPAFDGL